MIGGQTLSLLLTLLATPVFYSLFDDMLDPAWWIWTLERIFVPWWTRRKLGMNKPFESKR